VSGQDRKFPPAPGTNQIAGFREFRPLTSQEKNNYFYFKEIPVILSIIYTHMPMSNFVHMLE